MTDAYTHIEFNVNSIDDEWETLVSAGLAIVEAHDRNRWRLGDLAQRVVRRYGDESVKRYSLDINVRPSTMYEYVAMSAYYPDAAREEYPALSWSHYREARRLDDIEASMDVLGQAQDEAWTVERLAEEVAAALGYDPKPRKVAEFDATLTCREDGDMTVFTLTTGALVNELPDTVLVKLYAQASGVQAEIRVFKDTLDRVGIDAEFSAGGGDEPTDG